MSAGEFDLIARIRARVAQREDVVLGIGDDAALVQPPPGRHLVIAMDTLNAGVHFPPETSPADIGWKALAVNLSDLAAMGAEPAWCTLSLSLPHSDPIWLDAFIDGFSELAAQHRVALIGGDTTRGPLSVCVTVHGFVAPDRALRRDAARAGDDLWVTGTLGDAAAALAQWRAAAPGEASSQEPDEAARPLRSRLDRPTPRVSTGLRLVGVAHAAIDVSDGLLADLGHVLRASGVGAELDIDALPASPALLAAFGTDERRVLQSSGGDDYELCFSAPVAVRETLARFSTDSDTPLTRIGRVIADPELRIVDRDGRPWQAGRTGYDHFA